MRITVSLGATLFDADKIGNDLIHRADMALYEVKFGGGAGSLIRLRSENGEDGEQAGDQA